MRLIFMGTPDFAVPVLTRLAANGHEIVAVYTREAKPGGRGMALQPTPVAREAERLGLSVHTPRSLRGDEALAAFKAHGAEAAVVVAYGLILPKAILDAVPRGSFNLHASLLPRWRGAAPINRAIMAGDTESGVMVMRMEEGLDTGPVAMTARLPIAPDMTAGELHDALSPLGAELMARAMADLARDGALDLTPQPDEGVTYAAKIDKAEARIDWTRPWRAVHDHARGLSPFPGAWFEWQDGSTGGKAVRVKVLRSTRGEGSGISGTVLDDRLTVACGEGAMRLVELQRAGGRPMGAEEFLRGTPLKAGSRLS